MDVRGVIKSLESQLRQTGVAASRAEAEWLLAETLGMSPSTSSGQHPERSRGMSPSTRPLRGLAQGEILSGSRRMSRTELYLWEEPIDSKTLDSVHGLLKRRIKGEPLQYLIGHTEFCGHRLSVQPGVFIPRPETEALTEQAIWYLQRVVRQGTQRPWVLDLGTGSANIAISLALAVPTCVVVASELSWEALRVAKANVHTHQVGEQVWPIQADWTSGIKGQFCLIISNPPYVPTRMLNHLPADGQGEPRMSLDGGVDGMVFHRRLIDAASRLLVHGGALGVECAEDQAESLLALSRKQPWVEEARMFEDLAGRPRGLWIESRGQARGSS